MPPCSGSAQNKEVYEEEITEVTPTEAENPLSGYGKTFSYVVIGLKTMNNCVWIEAVLKERGLVTTFELHLALLKHSHSSS